MSEFVLKGRGLTGGVAEGEALVTQPINFFGAYMQGILSGNLSRIEDTRHELYGRSLEGKVLVIPYSIGSLAGGVALLEAIKKGIGPIAVINRKTDDVLLSGPVFARVFYGIEVPVIDSMDRDPLQAISTGDFLTVDGNRGIVRVTQKGVLPE